MYLYISEYNILNVTILSIAYNYQGRLSSYRGYVQSDGRLANYYDGLLDVYNPQNMYGFYKKINGLDSFVSEKEKWNTMTNANNNSLTINQKNMFEKYLCI